jgi:hypothetical protein
MEIEPKGGEIGVFIYYGPEDDISELQGIIRPSEVGGPLRGPPPGLGSELLCGAIAFNLVSSALLSWFRPRGGRVLVADASREDADLVVTQIASDGPDDVVVLIDKNGNQQAPIQLNGTKEDNIGLLQTALNLIIGR